MKDVCENSGEGGCKDGGEGGVEDGDEGGGEGCLLDNGQTDIGDFTVAFATENNTTKITKISFTCFS